MTIDAYLCAINALPDETLVKRFLSPARQVQLQKTRHPEAHQEQLAAELLLLYALHEKLGLAPAPLPWATDEHGKPQLPKGFLQFNLSHSKGLVLVALSDAPVGADLQRSGVCSPALLRRVLGSEELARVEAQTEADRQDAFTALWVVKEAYAKLDGGGLALPFSSILEKDGRVLCPDRPPAYVSQLSVPDGYFAAVCSYVPAKTRLHTVAADALCALFT